MSIRRKMLKVGLIKKPSNSEQLLESDLLPNSDLSFVQNSDTPSVQNSDTPSVQNSDTSSVQNSDTPLVQNSDTSLAQNSDTPSAQNSDTPSTQNSNPPLAQNLDFSLAPFPNISVYRKYSAFRSSRFKAVPRTERNQRPVLPVKKIIEENIAIRRLVYLHTGRCTERLPNQDSPITDLCVVPAIHVSKDMSDPDHPVSKFIKYNRVINVCGLTNCGSDSTSKEKNKFMKFIRSTGIYLRETEWIYGGQELNSVEKRRKTFERCNVMSPENINKLCEAGFYYIGDGKTEETMCFCCGKRVLYWGKSVKPWTTHAIITKDCYYMALCKGKYYVHQVYNDYQHIQSYCKTNFFEQLINIKYDENSFNEILSAPNYSDSEDESFSEVQSSKKIRRQPLTERLLTTVTINNTTEPILLCKICAKDIISVLIIPCGHVIACIQCALTLKDCPACTLLFDNETVFLRVFIVKTDKNIKRVNDYLKTDTNYVENPEIDQSLCKVCQKNDLVAYVPCRHIYSCSECTLTLNNSCPICNVGLIGMIQISLT